MNYTLGLPVRHLACVGLVLVLTFVGLVLGCTSSHAAGRAVRTSTTPTIWPDPIGKPVVFRWKPTARTGLRFAMVIRTNRTVDQLNAGLNDFSASVNQFGAMLADSRGRHCALAEFYGTLRRRSDGTSYWNLDPSVSWVLRGELITAEFNFFSDADSGSPGHTYAVRVHGIWGPRRSPWGQPTLSNPWPQKILKRIGCNGRIRPGLIDVAGGTRHHRHR